MKLTCVHAFTVLLVRNFCVSQFHQDSYNIIHDRIDIIEVNKTAAPSLILKVFKYNDTIQPKAINLTVDFRSGCRKNILLTFAVFKSVQKIYRPLPFPNYTLEVCEEFRKLGERNPFGIKSAIAKSNYKGCPAAPGVYYVDSWLLEEDKFPPHAPSGDYKLVLNAVVDDDIFVLNAEYYGSVIKKKKNNNKKH